MARRSWTFELDGRRHEARANLGYFSARRQLSIDGRLVLDVRPVLNATAYWQLSTDHFFILEGHEIVLRIRPGVMFYGLDLIVDGRSLGTGESVGALPAPKLQPRRGNRAAKVRRGTIIAGLILGLLLTLGLPSYYGLRELRFASEGQVASGNILARYQRSGRYGPTDHLQYSFTADFKRYVGDQAVSAPLYASASVGAPRSVQYLASDPTWNRVDDEIDRRSALLYGALGLVTLSTLALPFFLRWRRHRASALLPTEGIRTIGDVTGVEHRVGGATDEWLVRYRYSDATGTSREGVARPSGIQRPALKPGDRGQVAFDERHPDRSVWLE